MENIKKFELLSLLPIEVRKSKEFTKSQKRILSQLLFYNGMDKVRTDGCFFIDNDRLCKECKVTLKTLLIARNMFSNLGFITTTKGKKGKSTEYRINVDSIMNYNKKNTMTNSTNRVTKYGDKIENTVTKYSDKTSSIELLINRLDSIDYQFTKIPTKIMMAMDVNCRSMLFTMCQLSSYYADEQGIFFRTNADLAQDSQMSEKLVRATVDTLYIKGIIQVWSVGKSNGRHANKFRLNYNKFIEYDKYSMDDLRNPELRIETIKGYNKKGYTPSYLNKEISNTTQEIPIYSPTISQSTNNIDNIENINNINNINNYINNNNLLNIKNILKEKENIFINKNIKEKENILKNKKEIEVIKNIKNEDSALAEHAESNKKEIISISNEESCSGASTIEKLLVENDNILQLRGSYVKLFDVMGNLNSEEELDNTANSIHRWLKQHRDKQVLTQDESREMMFKLSERIHQLRSSIQSKSNTSQETAFSSSQSDLNGKDEQVINEKEKTQENVRKSLEMKLSEMLDKMELTPTMDKLDESYDSISDWLDENGDRLGKYSVRKIERRLNDVYFKHKDKVEYIPIEEVSVTVQPNVLS